jgi:hypothetical protein
MTVLGKKEIQMVSRAEQEKTIFQFLSAYADMTWEETCRLGRQEDSICKIHIHIKLHGA